MNTKVKYETGATSHEVNELILFAENTRELAEKRDSIYQLTLSPGLYQAELNVNGPIAAKNTLANMFTSLLRETISAYKKEFPTSHSHLSGIKHWDELGQEFCQLYANGLAEWKKGNSL